MAATKIVIRCKELGDDELWVYLNRPQAYQWTMCSPYLVVAGKEGTIVFSEKKRTGNGSYFDYQKSGTENKRRVFYLENLKPTNLHEWKKGMQGFGRFAEPPPSMAQLKDKKLTFTVG
jgi:hypothetical protein